MMLIFFSSLQNYHVLISPADLSNAYYRYKQSTCPSLPISIPLRPPTLIKRPEAAATHDADMPTYAAMYSQPPGLINDSCSSFSSVDSIITQIEEDSSEEAMRKYYKTDEPPRAHCRHRNQSVFEPSVSYNPFLRH